MTTMYNTLKRPDQTVIENAKVEITLVAGAGAAPGFVSGSNETILSVYSTLTDSAGRWEVDLVPTLMQTAAALAGQIEWGECEIFEDASLMVWIVKRGEGTGILPTNWTSV